jgi:hypothetical protein
LLLTHRGRHVLVSAGELVSLQSAVRVRALVARDPWVWCFKERQWPVT